MPSGWQRIYCPMVWDYANNDVANDGYIYAVIDGVRYGIKDDVAKVVRQPYNITAANVPVSVRYKGTAYPVTSIGYNAFYGCSLLSEITIPSSVTSIGDSAFYGCSALSEITIPAGVTSIGGSAFSGCSSLTIYCEAAEQPSEWNSYWNSSDRPVEWGYTKEK